MDALSRVFRFAPAFAAAALLAAPAAAQDIDPASDTAAFALNTGFYLAGVFGVLVALIGFCMRDVGLARVQNAPAVCLRTIGAFGICVFAFWIVGYNLIYSVEEGGLLGDFQIWKPDDADPMTSGRAAGAYWLFQAGLAVIGASIVSSAVSERVKLWPFLFFAGAFTALVYPIAASWTWGGGYFRSAWSFYDFGGAAVLHITAGGAALAAAMIVGPRPGKYDGASFGPSTALPISALGAVMVFIGLLAALAARQDSCSPVEAALSVSVIIVNGVLAGAGGVLAAIILTQTVYHRAGLVTGLSGLIAGLVSISADPVHPDLWQAAMIGAVGGVIVTVVPPFLDRYRIDDAGFVTPAHFLCGLWGALIVPWTNPDAWIVGQLLGASATAVFAFFMSMLLWVALKYTVGVRFIAADEHFLTDEDNG